MCQGQLEEKEKDTQPAKEDLRAAQNKTMGAVQPENEFHISAFPQ